MYDRFDILHEIEKWEEEINHLKNSDKDESVQISEIERRIFDLKVALIYAE